MRLNEIENTMKYKLFCDMDGVLVGFTEGRAELLKGHPEGTGFWRILHGMSFKEVENWWATLPWQPGGQELWSKIGPRRPAILSTPDKRPVYKKACSSGKTRWVKTHLKPSPSAIFLVLDKTQFASPNHILIDDREKVIKPFRDAGGIGILHTGVAATLEELRQYIEI